jgi:CRP/FNR family transcriptional regulator, dissimilatory nitrate respiration regulator
LIDAHNYFKENMTETRGVISGSQLFSGLPDEYLIQIANIATEREVKRGETIFNEGDDSNGFYLIVAGQIKVYKLSMDGKEQILHIFSNGEPFGEVPVFSGQKYPATAQAIAGSKLLFIERNAFVGLIEGNISLALNMLAVLSKRLSHFSMQIENLSLKEVPGRLASYLIYLSTESDNKGRVLLNISKGQLASLLGTIPETLSRIFLKMSKQKMIAVNGREIDILDIQAMKDLAENGKLIDGP